MKEFQKGGTEYIGGLIEAALALAGAMDNLITENIEGFDGAVSILDERII